MRKKLFIYTILFCSLVLISCNNHKTTIVPYELRCEYLANPLNLDEEKPRFSWKLNATNTSDFGQKQLGYRIIVSQSKAAIGNDTGDMWDSGWVDSENSQNITYEGKQLLSDRTYYWKIQVKDEKGEISDWSEVLFWNTGNFEASDWTAKWIGSNEVFDNQGEDCNIWDPWIRKVVELDRKPAKAIIFVASVGYHELYVNGEKVSEDVLSPLVNSHSHRASYVGYDIAPYLKSGKNVIAFWLGTSWSIFKEYYGNNRPLTPIVLAQSDVYYSDSSIEAGKADIRIVTDSGWKTKASSSKLLGKWETWNFGGELWDDSKYIPDWNAISLDDNSWANATEYQPELKLSAERAQGNRILDEIRPISIEENEDGSYRVDMGVNFAGWTEVKVKGSPGDTVLFRYSEREQEEMTFRLRSACVIGESGLTTFRNRFNYSSGRWITIRGLKEKPQLSDIKGWLVRTNYETASTFECSDPLQNWIYDRVLWTFENLSIGGYIVDCPQRERLGYGGDAHATSETGLFNYKMGAFYTKWMQDWRDVQGWESMGGGYVGGGILPHTAPTRNGGGGPAWGGICISLPWFVYQHEGDVRILESNFEMMTKWLEFLTSHTENGILKRFGGPWDFLGDWLWPNATAEGMNNNSPQTECLNSCYYVFNLRTAAKIAHIIGKTKEAEEWERQAELSSKAINDKFYDKEDCSYSDKSMGNLAAALVAEVPPVDLRAEVMKRLEKEILEVRNGHIHVGITAGALLFKLLRDEGRDDLIYSMTSQTTYPSWGYMKENDATTIWEMWEKDLPGHSLLHSSYLYPGAWYIDGLAGIKRSPDVPGFKEFVIRPPRLKASTVDWVKSSFDSPVGLIKSEWKKEGDKFMMNVTVPANSKAILYFPSEGEIMEASGFAKMIKRGNGYTQFELPAGSYSLSDK